MAAARRPLPTPAPPAAAEAECTFRPAINARSAALPGRSAVDLSRGDALRRETAQRLLRMRTEADVLEGASGGGARGACGVWRVRLRRGCVRLRLHSRVE